MTLRHRFSPPDNTRLAHLCGPLDEHLRTVEAALGVTIARRGEQFRIEGAKGMPEQAMGLLESLYALAARPIPPEQVQLALASLQAHQAAQAQAAHHPGRHPVPSDSTLSDDDDSRGPVLSTRRADLQGRTPNQVSYLRHILGHDLTFGIGPAGTGKTFLAVACAVDALERSAVQRIVLTRPAVEAGERLGFLPGDLAQKVDPYLRPLYDALYDMLDVEKAEKYLERGAIEVAPLAFMRGRTLNDAFVILDEAQNTTTEQMKMFLTRLGFGSKAVVTGDVTQIDLPGGRTSGLVQAMEVVGRIDGISFIHFDERDVVRHKLVQAIVKAYDAYGSGPSTR